MVYVVPGVELGRYNETHPSEACVAVLAWNESLVVTGWGRVEPTEPVEGGIRRRLRNANRGARNGGSVQQVEGNGRVKARCCGMQKNPGSGWGRGV